MCPAFAYANRINEALAVRIDHPEPVRGALVDLARTEDRPKRRRESQRRDYEVASARREERGNIVEVVDKCQSLVVFRAPVNLGRSHLFARIERRIVHVVRLSRRQRPQGGNEGVFRWQRVVGRTASEAFGALRRG